MSIEKSLLSMLESSLKLIEIVLPRYEALIAEKKRLQELNAQLLEELAQYKRADDDMPLVSLPNPPKGWTP